MTKKKNIKMQKFTVVVISVLLFFAMLLGVLFSVPKAAKAETESTASDITKMTDEEQQAINNDILEKWGNPTAQDLVKLEDGFTADAIGTSGDKWFYLDSDISGNISDYLNYTSGHLRIVLNGYSISGEFNIKAQNSGTQVSIFDRIPDSNTASGYKEGIGYSYNNATRYYSYNSSTGAYSTYSSDIPSGQEVTNMPTFKADTYIKVTGSAFAPNATTGNGSSASTWLNGYSNGIMNVYGINVVGNTTGRYGYFIIAEYRGIANIYQCNILGNNKGYPAVGTWSSGATVRLEGCNVYGNQSSNSNKGIQPADSSLSNRTADVGFGDGTINLKKSNIGALINGYGSNIYYTKAVYLKDVNFGTELSVTPDTVNTFFQDTAGISGTIELVYTDSSVTTDKITTYTANSPNLNFIVHGGSSTIAPCRGGNSLTIAENAVVGNISTVYGDVAENSIINNGTVTIAGTVDNITNAETGKIIIDDNSASINNITNSGTFVIPITASYTIEQDKTINGTIRNDGKLNILGTASGTLENNGKVDINGGTVGQLESNNGHISIKSGELTIASDKTVGGVIENASTLIIEGAMIGEVINKGDLQVSGSITSLSFISGKVQVLGENAKLQTDTVVPFGATMTIDKTATINVAITNNGELQIDGTMAGQVTNNGKVILNGGSIENLVNNSILQIMENTSYTIENGKELVGIIKNAGELVVNGAIYGRIENSGTVIINKTARVGQIDAQAGRVTIEDGAQIQTEPVKSGETAEIIDNRQPVVEKKKEFWALPEFFIPACAGAIVLVIVLIALIIFFVKRSRY